MFLKALSDIAGGHKHVDHQNDARVQEVAEFAVKQVVMCASAAALPILKAIGHALCDEPFAVVADQREDEQKA